MPLSIYMRGHAPLWSFLRQDVAFRQVDGRKDGRRHLRRRYKIYPLKSIVNTIDFMAFFSALLHLFREMKIEGRNRSFSFTFRAFVRASCCCKGDSKHTSKMSLDAYMHKTVIDKKLQQIKCAVVVNPNTGDECGKTFKVNIKINHKPSTMCYMNL